MGRHWKRVILGCVLAAFFVLPAGAQLPPPGSVPPPPPPPPLPQPDGLSHHPKTALYPAIPLSNPSLPKTGSRLKPASPDFTPSVQHSPVYPTSTRRMPGSAETGKRKPPASRVRKSAGKPDLTTAFAAYERNFEKCQQQLDRILDRHDGNWESLNRNEKDRKTCEEILKKWGRDEEDLAAVYRKSAEPAAPLTGETAPEASGGENGNGGELTTGDVDR